MTESEAGRLASTDEIRARFPALERRRAGRPVAYFDGPGGTQVPRDVVDAMADYLYHHNANTHWAYPTSAETDAAIAAAREALADFVGADASDIAFGANTTTLALHLARGLGREYGPGDEIVVTELSHSANIAPWRALAEERGITLRMVRMIPETGRLDWDDLRRKLTAKTRVLAIGAASNVLGTITDVRRATEMAQKTGALAFIDAVHLAPHALLDVAEIGCDFLACSAYKFYGPHIGVLYGKHALLESVDVPKLRPAPDTVPERMETGTQNHEGMVGAAAAVDFLASLAGGDGSTRRQRLRTTFAALHERAGALFGRLWQGLGAIDGVHVYGPPPDSPRTPTVAFRIAGVDPADAVRRLAKRGVFATHGDFYAPNIIERLRAGPDGLVRAGCSCYTIEDEVDRLVEGVRGVSGSSRCAR